MDVNVKTIAMLVVIGSATIVGWSFWRGHKLMKLYLLSATVLVGLVLATVAQIVAIDGLAEAANGAAIAFAFAGACTAPSLWRDEIRQDMDRMPGVIGLFEARDFLSWKGFLKLVDRIGARGAALSYLVPFAVLLTLVELTIRPPGPDFDRGFYLIAFAPVVIFAFLSAWYVYRAARRLVPGA